MAEELNHKCVMCGTLYYACDSCESVNNWRRVACSPECFKKWVVHISGAEPGKAVQTEPVVEISAVTEAPEIKVEGRPKRTTKTKE